MRMTALALFVAFAACTPQGEPPPAAAPPSALPPSAPSWSAVPPAANAQPDSPPGVAADGTSVRPPVPVLDAEPVIREQIFPGVKRCYQQGLGGDPTAGGRVVLQLHVAADGGVDQAWAEPNSGISAAVTECIAQVARRAHFAPPGGDGSKIAIPFNFVRTGVDGGA